MTFRIARAVLGGDLDYYPVDFTRQQGYFLWTWNKVSKSNYQIHKLPNMYTSFVLTNDTSYIYIDILTKV